MTHGSAKPRPQSVLQTTGVWKWIAGALLAIMASNLATALTFRTGDDHIRKIAESHFESKDEDIKKIVESHFTETSRSHGLYAIEGRPRLERLEAQFQEIQMYLAEIRADIAVIRNELKNK